MDVSWYHVHAVWLCSKAYCAFCGRQLLKLFNSDVVRGLQLASYLNIIYVPDSWRLITIKLHLTGKARLIF